MIIGNLEVYGIIYKIQNIVNGKIYIGQTIQKNGFDDRYRGNLERYTHNEYLRNSIHKYGIENFEINKIFDVAFSKDELDIKEKCWINVYNSIDKSKGYNISEGGSNGFSLAGKSKEEIHHWKRSISKSLTGRTFSNMHKKNLSEANKDKHPSRTTRNKMSEIRKNKYSGKNHPRYGKHLSEEHKNKLSEANKGKKRSLETILKMKKAKSKYTGSGAGGLNARKVICVTTNKIFNKLKDGQAYYKCFSVSECCQGKIYYSGELLDGTKLQWMYYDDYIKLIENNNINHETINNQLKEKLNKKRNQIKCVCEICGNEFERRKSYVNKSKHHYCSKECARKRYKLNYSEKTSLKYNNSMTHKEKNKINLNVDKNRNTYKQVIKKKDIHKTKLITENKNIKKCTNIDSRFRIENIICVETKKIFKYATEAIELYNIKRRCSLYDVLNGKQKTAGKLEDGTKLHWKYIEDLTQEEYIKYNIENKLKELHNRELGQAI